MVPPTVLHVVNQLTGVGGSETSLMEIITNLHRDPFPMAVATFSVDADPVERLAAAGVRSFTPSTPLVTRRDRYRHVRRVVDEVRPGLIHTTLFEADLIGRLVARMTRTPVVTSLVNTPYVPAALAHAGGRRWKVRGALILERWLARHATDAFQAISHATAEAAVRDLGADPERIVVVPRGRDVGRLGRPSAERRLRVRDRLDIHGDRPLLLCVGREEPQKAHVDALRALASLRDRYPEVLLVIAGRTGRSTPELDRIVRELGLGGHVLRLGHRDDVGDLLAMADVFVLSSLFEGMPGAVIEAMAMELPIVATDIPSVREILDHGRLGSLAPPGDPDRLADAIDATLGDRSGAAARAALARQQFMRRFTLDVCLDGMRDFYCRCMGGPSPVVSVASSVLPIATAAGMAARSSSHETVLHVVNQLAGVGGSEISLMEIITRLHGDPYPFAVATFEPDAEAEAKLAAAGVRSFAPTRPLSTRWDRYRHVRRSIEEVQPALVHTTLFEADLVGRLAARVTRSRVVTSLVSTPYDPAALAFMDGRRWKLRGARLLERWLARHATDAFHAVSRAAAAAAIRDLRVDPRAITVVPRGRDLARLGQPSPERRERVRVALGIRHDQPVVLCVGREEPAKSQVDAIRAIESLRTHHPDILLVVAGRRGRSSPELDRWVNELDLGKHVLRLGHRSNIGDLLAMADVLVLPSLLEGMPGAMTEAMAMHLPVVATDIPVVREILEDGRLGALAPPRDPDGLAAAIDEVLRDRGQAAIRAGAAHDKFLRHYTLDVCVGGMREFYRGQLAAARRSVAPRTSDAGPSAISGLDAQRSTSQGTISLRAAHDPLSRSSQQASRASSVMDAPTTSEG